jgi:hypothetical protein
MLLWLLEVQAIKTTDAEPWTPPMPWQRFRHTMLWKDDAGTRRWDYKLLFQTVIRAKDSSLALPHRFLSWPEEGQYHSPAIDNLLNYGVIL